MTLMPVSNIFALTAGELVEVRSGTVDVPVGVDADLRRRHVEGFTHDVPHVAKRAVTDGHLHAVPGVGDLRSTGETIGWLHRDGSNAAVTDLLSNLERNDDRLAVERQLDQELRVDLWKSARWELHVDHRSGDADHAA